MAGAYPDSSFLVSLQREDAQHETARAFLTKAALALPFTPLHRMEVRNALRNAVSFGHLTPSACRNAFLQIEEDLADGVLIQTPINWTNAFRRADELSEEHATRDGQRAIDLLHVAIALDWGATVFLSFDRRQRRLAAAAGLKVKP